jgi:hypothetical protein
MNMNENKQAQTPQYFHLSDNVTVTEYDSWNNRIEMRYNSKSQKFERPLSQEHQRHTGLMSLYWIFHNAVYPTGEISPEYKKYVMWRAVQRFIAATNNVFGTQGLLLALGFKRSSIGLAAATTWVLKDAMGKVSFLISFIATERC